MSELQQLWTQLKRFRGSPPGKVAEYFHPEAVIAYLATGRVYSGFAQVEQLMASHRDAFHFISETEVLSAVYDISNSTIVEEVRIKVMHNRLIEWLAPGIKGTASEFDLNLCTVTALKDVKIWRQRVYWDNALVLKALKAFPGSVSSVADIRVADAVSPAFGVVKQEKVTVAARENQETPARAAYTAPKFEQGPVLPKNTSVKVSNVPGGKSSFVFG